MGRATADINVREMTANQISVVIPTFNSSKTLRNCLSSLTSQLVKAPEIIIVDGNSTDATKNIAKDFPDVKFITNTRSHFPSASRNLGAQEASGDVVLFIDSDCFADRHLIYWHAASYQHNARLMGVQGVVRSAQLSKFARAFQSHFTTNYWINNVKPDGTSSLNGVAGTNLSLNRELFLRNKFSEDLISCEDIELFMKLRKVRNAPILLEPRAAVYHKHPSNVAELFTQRKWHGEGLVGFYRKYWRSRFQKNSILNTSKRYVKWDNARLASALFSDHRQLCKDCPLGTCRITHSFLPRRTLENAHCLRRITCLGYAAGIYKVRSGIDYGWNKSFLNS